MHRCEVNLIKTILLYSRNICRESHRICVKFNISNKPVIKHILSTYWSLYLTVQMLFPVISIFSSKEVMFQTLKLYDSWNLLIYSSLKVSSKGGNVYLGHWFNKFLVTLPILTRQRAEIVKLYKQLTVSQNQENPLIVFENILFLF